MKKTTPHRRRGRKTFDWNSLRTRFCSSEMTLTQFYELLKSENEDQEDYPSYNAIQTKCVNEDWMGLREGVKNHLAASALRDPFAVEILEQTKEFISAAETVRKHVKLARQMSDMAGEISKIVLPALRKIKPEDITAGRIPDLVRVFALLLNNSTTMEREALKLVNPEEIKINIDLNRLTIDEIETYQKIVSKAMPSELN